MKPDPGKQARSAEINSPQRDKGTDLLTARAAAFPQAQQQLPRSSPETCTQPHWQPLGKAARNTLLPGSRHRNPSPGFLTKSAGHSNSLGSESKELTVTACSSFSILALLPCTAKGMVYKHPLVFPTCTLLSAHLQYKQALSFVPKHSRGSYALTDAVQVRVPGALHSQSTPRVLKAAMSQLCLPLPCLCPTPGPGGWSFCGISPCQVCPKTASAEKGRGT